MSSVFCLVIALVGCGSSGGSSGGQDSGAEDPLLPLHATRGSEAGIFDALDRQVQLRGVNFNHLGDYFESHAQLPMVADLTDEDWADAAARGMNVVRLVTSWSAWAPERGSFSTAYLERVREAVVDANAHGIYVVIDMHQDAWSKHVFTPADETCPEGTRPQIGWDGAPAWATFTDGEPTCTPGSREDSPAVRRAWDNFYANRDGVRDELASLWARIATAFAHEPGVAGYDLLNEPGNGVDGAATADGLTAFYRSAITAIRAAEQSEGVQGHILFFETSVFASLPAFDLSDDPNLVFAPHNYFESIVGGDLVGLLDLSFGLFDVGASLYRTTIWVGEYGHFGTQDDREAWMARFAALEDRYPASGGTWWQWEQECGDPHDVSGVYPPSPEWVAMKRDSCGTPRMPTTVCGARAYPRAVPGRLTGLTSVPCGEVLIVSGVTETLESADLWFPSASQTAPVVDGVGIESVRLRKVPGGWRLAVHVAGDYRIEVTP